MRLLFAGIALLLPARPPNPKPVKDQDRMATAVVKPPRKPAATLPAKRPPEVTQAVAPQDSADADHATYYVVVADTSLSYGELRRKMIGISQQLAIGIDTMERSYDKAKNLIALPDTCDDDMYAGDYYPRRQPSRTLSLEYLYWYQPQVRDKTIALVTGIYEEETSADSALLVVRQADKQAYKIKANIYIGCLH